MLRNVEKKNEDYWSWAAGLRVIDFLIAAQFSFKSQWSQITNIHPESGLSWALLCIKTMWPCWMTPLKSFYRFYGYWWEWNIYPSHNNSSSIALYSLQICHCRWINNWGHIETDLIENDPVLIRVTEFNRVRCLFKSQAVPFTLRMLNFHLQKVKPCYIF